MCVPVMDIVPQNHLFNPEQFNYIHATHDSPTCVLDPQSSTVRGLTKQIRGLFVLRKGQR